MESVYKMSILYRQFNKQPDVCKARNTVVGRRPVAFRLPPVEDAFSWYVLRGVQKRSALASLRLEYFMTPINQ